MCHSFFLVQISNQNNLVCCLYIFLHARSECYLIILLDCFSLLQPGAIFLNYIAMVWSERLLQRAVVFSCCNYCIAVVSLFIVTIQDCRISKIPYFQLYSYSIRSKFLPILVKFQNFACVIGRRLVINQFKCKFIFPYTL